MKITKIKGRLNWNAPEIATAFVEGKDAKAIYDACDGIRTGDMGYDNRNKLFYGSTPFIAARIDTLVKPLGLRAANLRDLSRPEVMSMIKDRFYATAPVLVLRSEKDSYSRNLPLIKRIIEEAEKTNGKVELPLMITGFDVKKWESAEQGYGIDIVPRADFKAIHDERLSGKYDRQRFSEVDESGMPKFLKFNKSGIRGWYARNEGLSGLCLHRNLDLNSDGSDHLHYSYWYGRMVLVKELKLKEVRG